MGITLGSETLKEITAIVRGRLPVPNGGTLVRENSWAQVKSPLQDLTDHAILHGEGGSEFQYSDGVTIVTNWRFYVGGFQVAVIIDQEEVIYPEQTEK